MLLHAIKMLSILESTKFDELCDSRFRFTYNSMNDVHFIQISMPMLNILTK